MKQTRQSVHNGNCSSLKDLHFAYHTSMQRLALTQKVQYGKNLEYFHISESYNSEVLEIILYSSQLDFLGTFFYPYTGTVIVLWFDITHQNSTSINALSHHSHLIPDLKGWADREWAKGISEGDK